MNLKVYKQFVPPEYPVEKVTAPVILYNGLNDWLAHPKVIVLSLLFLCFSRQKSLTWSIWLCNFAYYMSSCGSIITYFIMLSWRIILGCGATARKITEYRRKIYGDVEKIKSLRLCIWHAHTRPCLQSSDWKDEFHSIRVAHCRLSTKRSQYCLRGYLRK